MKLGNKFRRKNVGRDWRLLLALTAVILVVIFVGYFQANSGLEALAGSTATSSSNKTVVLQPEKLQETADQLQSRQSALEALEKAPPTISDPSL